MHVCIISAMKLQQRTQSVIKKVELYEGLNAKAAENRANSYTFWRRKLSGNKDKPKNQPPPTDAPEMDV